jgi:hypothetical protein
MIIKVSVKTGREKQEIKKTGEEEYEIKLRSSTLALLFSALFLNFISYSSSPVFLISCFSLPVLTLTFIIIKLNRKIYLNYLSI